MQAPLFEKQIQLLHKHKQFILYCLCGGTGVSTDYGVYLLAMAYSVTPQPANLMGYLAGTLLSFFLNRLITFAVKDQMLKRLAIFIGVAAVGYSASALLLWLLIDDLDIHPKLAKLLTLPVVVVLQFSLNRRITFSTATSGNAKHNAAKI
jgi:putative flippase GtrA